MLEWQFQKRLQESKQSDDDDEEEDDEDVDTMLIMQRLEAEKRARVRWRGGDRSGRREKSWSKVMNNRDIQPGEMGGAEIMTCCLGQK